VLELVTEPLAAAASKSVQVPTIGIGAGRGCDGQVLVYHDMVRYGSGIRDKRFVKTYADVGTTIRRAIEEYVSDVKSRRFPEEKHGFPAAQDSAKEMAVSSPLYGGDSQS
jgi:3-methyl-2-oxobutanoate hydroxymethyltransferase